ncbi:MAG TPA: SPOR domain-containing protein [Steroidobacteraceae bacterium]
MGGALRFLFLLLLLANLLFLAWVRWVAPPEVAVRDLPPAAASQLQPIRLQREPAGPGSTDQAGPSSSVAGDVAAATCVSVGPFASAAQAEAASAALQRLGFAVRPPRAATDEVRVGSWVRVPHLATPEDATNALTTLQAAGLKDAYVVSEGEPDTTVSVGVFADPAKAAEVARTVAAAGFTPEVSDRMRTLDVLWLDIDRQANGSLPALDAITSRPNGDLPLEMRACPAEPPGAGQG